MDEASKRYMMVVQLKPDSQMARLAKDVPKIIEFLSRMSKGEQEQAFRSNDGLLFAFFFRSRLPGAILLAEFDKCEGTINGDHVLIFEVGDLLTARGFSRAWTWLQHH